MLNFKENIYEKFVMYFSVNDFHDSGLEYNYCNFDNDYYEDNLFNILGVPYPAKLERAVVKRKAEFLAGRYCANKSLSKLDIVDFSINTGDHGSPIWPSGIIGSISHCTNNAISVACRDGQFFGVGIDIESIISTETRNNIQHLILSEDEVLLLNQSENKSLLFTIAFSVKESFFKAAYGTVRNYLNFDAVSIIAINTSNNTIELKINGDVNDNLEVNTKIWSKYIILPSNKLITLVALSK